MARRDVVTKRTQIAVERRRGVFMISVAAELAEMHPQTLRMYEARGLIEPKRSPKGTRLYSQEDVERLRRIQEMTSELGLNLAGVERVLEMEEKLERAQRRVEALEARAAEHFTDRAAEAGDIVTQAAGSELSKVSQVFAQLRGLHPGDLGERLG